VCYSDEEFKKVLEENMAILEDNAAVRVLGKLGEERGIEQGKKRNNYFNVAERF